MDRKKGEQTIRRNRTEDEQIIEQPATWARAERRVTNRLPMWSAADHRIEERTEARAEHRSDNRKWREIRNQSKAKRAKQTVKTTVGLQQTNQTRQGKPDEKQQKTSAWSQTKSTHEDCKLIKSTWSRTENNRARNGAKRTNLLNEMGNNLSVDWWKRKMIQKAMNKPFDWWNDWKSKRTDQPEDQKPARPEWARPEKGNKKD